MKNCIFQAGLKDGKKLYTIERELGLLMEYDLDTFSYKIVTQLESNQMTDGVWRVNSIVKVEDVLYLSFRDHDFLMAYDIKVGSIAMYGEDRDGRNGIEKILHIGDELWLIPYCTSREVKVFKLQSKQFEVKFSLQKQLCRNRKLENGELVHFITASEGQIYAFLWNTPYIISIDLSGKKVQMHEVEGGAKIVSATSVGTHIWFSFANNTKVVKWSIEKGIQETMDIKELPMDDRGCPIINLFEIDDKIFLIPRFHTKLYSYKKIGAEWNLIYIKGFNRINQHKNNDSFRTYIFKENQMMLFPFDADRILIADLQTGEWMEQECVLSREDVVLYDITKKRVQKGIVEKSWFSLEDFLKLVELKDR